MKNAYLSSHDPIIIYVYDSNQTIEMFGEDTLLEDGVSLPESLIARYKQNQKEFWDIQKELAIFRK